MTFDPTTTLDWTPKLVTVFCDECGVEHPGEYAVPDDQDALEVARKWMVTNAGWYSRDGMDLCPRCASGNGPKPGELNQQWLTFLEYRQVPWCDCTADDNAGPHGWRKFPHIPCPDEPVDPSMRFLLAAFQWDAVDAGIIRPSQMRTRTSFE